MELEVAMFVQDVNSGLGVVDDLGKAHKRFGWPGPVEVEIRRQLVLAREAFRTVLLLVDKGQAAKKEAMEARVKAADAREEKDVDLPPADYKPEKLPEVAGAKEAAAKMAEEDRDFDEKDAK